MSRSAGTHLAGVRSLAGPVLVLAVIALVFAPLTPAYDIDVFLRGGLAVLHGHDPYPAAGTPGVYSGHAFVYPYMAAWPFVGLALLGRGTGTAIFFAVSAAAVIAACMVRTDDGPWRSSLVLASACTITGLQLGALGPLLFAGVVALWHLRVRPTAFLGAGPVVAAKLFLAPLLVWPALARRYRALAWAAASTAAVLALSFALGPIGPGAYARILSELGGHEAPRGFGVAGTLMQAGASATAAEAVAVVVAGVLLVAARGRHRRTASEPLVFAAAIVLSLVLTPVLWSHYLVVLAAVLVAYDAPREWFVMFALVSWGVSAPHGVPHPVVFEALAWLAAAAYLPMLVRRTRRGGPHGWRSSGQEPCCKDERAGPVCGLRGAPSG